MQLHLSTSDIQLLKYTYHLLPDEVKESLGLLACYLLCLNQLRGVHIIESDAKPTASHTKCTNTFKDLFFVLLY